MNEGTMNDQDKPTFPRGMGSLYRQKGSPFWWIQYNKNGKRYRESTHTTSDRKAQNFLKNRLGEMVSGKFVGPAAERVLVSELAEDVLRDMTIEGNKDTIHPKMRWEKHLKPTFGHLKAVEVTRPMLDAYVTKRLEAGASNASVNREVAFLKRCFRLGLEREKVARVPSFPTLAEDNTREGFPTEEEFAKLKTACATEGLWLRAMLELAATFGWRKSSLLAMQVRNVDLLNGTVRQEGSTTKSGEGNEVKLTPDLKVLLAACMEGKGPDDYLFTRIPKKQRNENRQEQPVQDFREAWERATKAAGIPHLLFHDLCRFACRNLDSAGVSQVVGMSVMGRKTDSIYRRYRIVDRRDVDRAVDRLVKYAAERSEIQKCHKNAIVSTNSGAAPVGDNAN